MSDDDLAVWLGEVMDGAVAAPSRAELESLSHHDDLCVAGLAIVLLGRGGPDPQEASTLLARAQGEQVPVLAVALYVGAARMDLGRCAGVDRTVARCRHARRGAGRSRRGRM